MLAAFAVLAAASAVATRGPASARAASSPATVWLCRPGTAGDPCAVSLQATVVSASNARSEQNPTPASSSPFDCFYVYPTVSSETTVNADLRVQPAEREVAVAQASRFSQLCRVWAPMYRQETLAALFTSAVATSVRAQSNAYASLLSAWRDYLAHDNDGRPIVFIGHSQGASMLIRLLASQVDPNAALRRRLVAAVILGGNVTVANGRTTGGSFRNIPACTAPSTFGCVIAYSSFPGTPPGNSLFGRPGQGVSLLSGQTATAGVQVLCVNPAAIGSSGAAPLEPYSPTSLAGTIPAPPVTTPWVSFPALYTAQCRQGGGASWLAVDDVGSRSDRRPRIAATAGPEWGYHSYDVNIALGNLVGDVAGEEAAYERARH